MNTALSPLSLRSRAELYKQLAQLESAGLPSDRMLLLLRLPGAGQTRLQAMRKLLARRGDFAAAGECSGVFTTTEARIIHAAMTAGSPARSYARLAEHYTRRATQRSAIKSRMLLPCLMLLAASFIQPITGLVTGALNLTGYLAQSLRPVSLLAVLYFVASLLRHRTASWQAFDRLLTLIPLFGVMTIRRNLRDFLESLSLLLEAGVAMFEAVPEALNTVSNTAVRQRLSPMLDALKQGTPFATAFAQVLDDLPHTHAHRALAFVGSGESSGTLPEMLMRHAIMETGSIAEFDEQVAAWLPRLAYACVAAWIAYGLLSGPGIMAQSHGNQDL